jgi:outer membrane receptor protein involved in Fe transport
MAGRVFAIALLFCLASALAATLLSSVAYAAVELPTETVVASPVGEAAGDKYLSPGAVTVIRPEEMAGEQRTLPDLLENVPGLRVIRVQGRHGYAVASVRGSTSAQVAVYVDGVLMNLQSEAAVDLSAIPVDNVLRIEVYKGYVPAQFGAQAMGGVINIVTKMPQKPETHLSLGAGSFGKYKGSVSYGAPLRDGKLFASFGYETYAGDFRYINDNGTPYSANDDYIGKRRDNGFTNTDVLLKWEDEHWRARASWVRRDRELALLAPGLDKRGVSQRPGALLDTDRWDVSLARSQKTGPVGWSVELLYTGQTKNYDSRRGSAPSNIGGSYVMESEYDTSRFGVSLSAKRPVGERHILEFLGEYAAETLDVRGDALFAYLNGIGHYSRNDLGFNLQDTIALDRAGTFTATPSIRWHGMDDDSHFTWQIALTKELSPSWMLKSVYGTYARAPNTYERYGDGAFILPSDGDLKWETGTQFDLGLIWNGNLPALGGAEANASLSGFWRNSENLIEFDMENPRYARYKNIAEAEVKGAELEAGLDWKKWNMSLSATWIKGENKTGDSGSVRSDGMTLPNRPEWSGVARLTYKFGGAGEAGAKGTGSVFAEYQYVGENFADSSEKVLFDSRSLWNLGVKYRLNNSSELVFGVDDLFNDAEGWRIRPNPGLNGPTRMLYYPVEGRSYYLTLNIEL